MRFKGLISSLGISSAILITSFVLSSCTCKISEEDYNKLQELRKQERTLTQDISKKKDDKAAIDRELKARQSEVNKCNEDRDFVQKKLSQWPNVWPDYVPPTN